MLVFDLIGILAIAAVVGVLFLFFKFQEKGAWNLLLLSLFLLGLVLSSIVYKGDLYFSFTSIQSIIICSIGFTLVALHSGIGLNFSFNDDFVEKVMKAGLSFLLLVLIIVMPVFYFILKLSLVNSFILSLLFLPVLFLRKDRKAVEHIMKDMSVVLVGFVLIMIGVFLSLNDNYTFFKVISSLVKTLVLSVALSFAMVLIAGGLSKKVKDHFFLVLFVSLVAVGVILWFGANMILTLIIFAILFGSLYIKKRNIMLTRLDDFLKYVMYVGVFFAPFMVDYSSFNKSLILYGFLMFLLVLLIKTIVISTYFGNYHIKELIVITMNHNLSISVLLLAFIIVTGQFDVSNEVRGIIVSAVCFSFVSSFLANRLSEVLEDNF